MDTSENAAARMENVLVLHPETEAASASPWVAFHASSGTVESVTGSGRAVENAPAPKAVVELVAAAGISAVVELQKMAAVWTSFCPPSVVLPTVDLIWAQERAEIRPFYSLYQLSTAAEVSAIMLPKLATVWTSFCPLEVILRRPVHSVWAEEQTEIRPFYSFSQLSLGCVCDIVSDRPKQNI